MAAVGKYPEYIRISGGHMRKNALVLILFTVISCLAIPAFSVEIPEGMPSWKGFDPEKLASLLKYGELFEVDYIGGDKVEAISIGMLADAPPEKVWNVISDFEGYANLLPDQLKTESIEKGTNTEKVRFTVSVLKLGLIDINTKYVLKYKMDKPRRLDIGWVEGDVKNVVGYWELIPVAGGKKTVAIYVITSDLGSASPIVGAALKEQPATVMAINLSSAIIFTQKIMEKADGKKRPSAPEGSDPIWRTLDPETLNALLKGGRVGFISRIGKKEVATSGALVNSSPEKTWGVLTNFAEYPEKIQQITRAKITSESKDSVKVKLKTEILRLGPIKIASEGVTVYKLKKPEYMESSDEKNKNSELFNRWFLLPVDGGAKTALFNEAVSDISGMGTVANMMLSKLPALQVSVDLSQAMIMTDEIKKWADSK